MIMTIRLTISMIGRGHRSQESGHNEIYYNSTKMQLRTNIPVEVCTVQVLVIYVHLYFKIVVNP